MDYWVIYEKDSFSSFHNYNSYMKFASYEDAESFLLRDKTIIKAEQKYADLFIADDIIFQSTTHNISDTLMVNKFQYYTQSIIVVMIVIRMMLMYWNCQMRR